ncbi:MAG: hypothetical protein ACK5Q5_05585 [Planctomycetaceae bacterium]
MIPTFKPREAERINIGRVRYTLQPSINRPDVDWRHAGPMSNRGGALVARRSSSGAEMSLFPFMSILVCLIGSLTLMIALLMATQVNSEQSDKTVERYQKFTELQADIAFQKGELDSIQSLMKDASHLSDEARKALAEIAALEKEQQKHLERVDANSGYAKMLAESNSLRKRISELQQDPKELQKQIDDLEKEVKRRNAGPEEAVVQIRPGGSGVGIDPTFVECTATGLVVHGTGEPQQIRSGDITKDGGDFFKLLDSVAGKKNGQIIFLLRPDGVNSYNSARNFARTSYTDNGYARNGKLPVPSQGNLDLSVFRSQ